MPRTSLPRAHQLLFGSRRTLGQSLGHLFRQVSLPALGVIAGASGLVSSAATVQAAPEEVGEQPLRLAEAQAADAARTRVAEEALFGKAASDPTIAEQQSASSAHRAWFGTDWFIASRANREEGDPTHNLWAKNGPLEKLDRLKKERSGRGFSAQKMEQRAPRWMSFGLGPAMKGGALAASTVAERGFLRSVPQLETLIFGEGVKVEPRISNADFMLESGAQVFLEGTGDRIAAVLDGKVLEARKTTVDGRTVVQHFLGDRVISWAEADRAYYTVVDPVGVPKGDGLLSQQIDVDWWGNCDDATLAGLLFETPVHPVERNGVAFSPRDIQGLLTLVASERTFQTETVGTRYNKFIDQVVLKDGSVVRGEILEPLRPFELATPNRSRGTDWREVPNWAHGDLRVLLRSGETKIIPAGSIQSAWAQFWEDLDPKELRETALAWAKSGGGAGDVDPLERIYNRPFDEVQSTVFSERPSWARDDGRLSTLPDGAKLEWGEITIGFADSPRTYRYWRAELDGRSYDFGYQGVRPPDFLWRPKLTKTFEWPKQLTRNPGIDVELVRELYEASISSPDRS